MRLTDDSGTVFEALADTDHILTDVSGFVGDLDTVSTKTQNLGDGTVLAPIDFPGRSITLSGTSVNLSPSEVRALDRLLSGILRGSTGPDFRLGTVEVDDASGTWLHCRVQPDGKASVAAYQDAGYVDWQIPLYSADPHWYGVEHIFNLLPPGSDYGLDYPLFVNGGVLTYGSDSVTQAVVRNDGSCPAWPVIAVKGNFASGVRLGDGHGHWVTYQGMCVWSQPVYFDFAAKSAYTATGDCSIALTERNFWSVPAHGQVQPVLQPIQAGSGFAELAISDTYM